MIGYGLTKTWDIYFQLGVADVKNRFHGADGDRYGLNFDNDFAWGWGTRITLLEQDNVQWGLSAQMNGLDTRWDQRGRGFDGEEPFDWHDRDSINSYDWRIAFGPTVDMGGWKLYGGPFYYQIEGEEK